MTDRYEDIRKALALLDSGDYCERAIGHSKLRNACRPDTLRALLSERDALREALALLPDEHDMIEHNPDEGPRTFCCWQEIKLRGLHDYLITHDEGCWYARMRALRGEEAVRLNTGRPPEGYVLISEEVLRVWGKLDEVRECCRYPHTQ